jgi:hypothetical protein
MGTLSQDFAAYELRRWCCIAFLHSEGYALRAQYRMPAARFGLRLAEES